jgi:hypothetical protein
MKTKTTFLYALFLTGLLVSGLQLSGFSQEKLKCKYISGSNNDGIPAANDIPLFDVLAQKYDMTVLSDDEILAGIESIENMVADCDFIFVSETVGSDNGGPLKGISKPIFTTKLWLARQSSWAWVAEDASGTNFGNIPLAGDGNVIKIMDSDHDLSAGFEADQTITVVTGSNNPQALTFCAPDIAYSKIAVSANDESKVVVLGVEKGTALYDGATADGSIVTGSRIAAVGIHSQAYGYITEDAFKLIYAGIDWIMHSNTTGVSYPSEITSGNMLGNCYPNPFSQNTTIAFHLAKRSPVRIDVFNIAGQQVRTLVNDIRNAGEFQVSWNAQNDAGQPVSQGVYIYRMTAGTTSQSRKVMLE